jgi:hypothetical protein
MKTTSLILLKACTLSVALLGSAAIVAAISLPEAAFAKSGNDNGNGGGNGNGNGNGSGNGNGNGGGNGNSGGNGNGGGSAKSGGGSVEKSGSTKADGTSKSKAKTKSASKKKDILDGLGLSASDLGALNAAKANPNALKNASPNSRVGKIAAFRDAVLAGQVLEADLAEKTAILEALPAPDRPSTDVDVELQTAVADTDAKAATVTQLEADLAAAGGADPAIEAELDAARDTLATAEEAEAALRDEYDTAVEYETVAAEVDDLTEKVAAQPEVERDLLEAASNKPVTDAVEAAVRKLLGL